MAKRMGVAKIRAKRITARQKAARRKNIAIARTYKKRGSKKSTARKPAKRTEAQRASLRKARRSKLTTQQFMNAYQRLGGNSGLSFTVNKRKRKLTIDTPSRFIKTQRHLDVALDRSIKALKYG